LVVLVAACSSDSNSDETTSTGALATTTSAAQETTTTALQETTTTTLPWSEVPATADTVMVYGSWVDTTRTQTGSESTDGVEVDTFVYSEGLVLSDSRASGTTEYVATV
jgi:hypothetical protein